MRPSTVTRPSSISFWRYERDWPATTDARKRSRRWPSNSSETVTVKGGMSGSLPRPFRRRRASPSQGHEHNHRQGREDQRNELGCGEHENRAPRVVAVELDDEARDRVEQHVD